MKFSFTLLLLFLVLMIRDLPAGGFDYNTTFGTRAFSLDGLYYAGNAGLGSVFSNPAGLGLLRGIALEGSIINKIEQNEFSNSIRGFYKSYNNENYSAGGGAYWNINEQFTVAAAYHPFIDYRVDWPFVVLRNTDITPFSMMNRLEINSISPAVAFHSGPLYIGLAGNVYQSVNQINFPRYNPDTVGFSDYQFEYNMDAWSFGGTLGILYDINESLRAGLLVKSGFELAYEGDARSKMFFDTDSSASTAALSTKFEIPWKFGFGVLYLLNRNVALNIDISYSLWGSTKKSRDFVFDNQVWQNNTSGIDSLTGFAANSIALNFNNSIDFGIGFEYAGDGGILYRAGYRFSQSPASSETYNFLFPTGDQNILSAGIGYKEENLTIDAGIAYHFGITKTIEMSDSKYLFGEYFTDGYIPSLTIRYEF